MAIIPIQKGQFENEVLRQDGPVVVDFWAPWCGYCRRLAPAVERLSESLAEKIRFVSVNVDDLPDESEEIEVIPTLVLFQNGKMVDAAVNPGSEDAITDWLTALGVL